MKVDFANYITCIVTCIVSLAHIFNKMAAVDLKSSRNGYTFHLVDHTIRFSAEALI